MDLKAQLEDARARGTNPVLLSLDLESPQARAIYEALGRPPIDGATDRATGFASAVVTREEANRLLQAHCEKGGDAVASWLESPMRLVELWHVWVAPPGIRALAFGTDKKALAGVTVDYANVRASDYSPFHPVNATGPANLAIEFDDGSRERVYGASSKDATMAGALATLVQSGRLPLPPFGDRHLTDDDLASLLFEVYADQPAVVKEAITVLEKLPGSKHHRLTRILWGRPKLRGLAKAVKRETTGE